MTRILADTNIWIDYLRHGNDSLERALEDGLVLSHPMVAGELALGILKNRHGLLSSLDALPRTVLARDDEVRRYIDRNRLHGRGIGYVDAHLLASTRLTPDARLWTSERRLAGIADESGIAYKHARQ